MQNKRSITLPDCCGFCKHFTFEAEEEDNFCDLVDPEDDARYDANFFDICDDFEKAE